MSEVEMVRMPIIPEGWLDGGQDSGTEAIAPANAGGTASTGPRNPIGPVQGYPEDGRHAWRAANDDVIVKAVKDYNSSGGHLPGDMTYMTPQLMKTWMMRESGGRPEAFRTDPFQVNNAGDWPEGTNEKSRIAGLSRGQAMTPQTSADAALKWLHYKGRRNPDNPERLGPYLGHYYALRNYNAAPGSTGGIPNKDEYANDVVNRAWSSYGNWQK
jgi:hypothetical protein